MADTTDRSVASEIRTQTQHISDLLNYVARDLSKKNAPLDDNHVFVRAGNTHTALMDLAHRLDRQQGDTPNDDGVEDEIPTETLLPVR